MDPQPYPDFLSPALKVIPTEASTSHPDPTGSCPHVLLHLGYFFSPELSLFKGLEAGGESLLLEDEQSLHGRDLLGSQVRLCACTCS